METESCNLSPSSFLLLTKRNKMKAQQQQQQEDEKDCVQKRQPKEGTAATPLSLPVRFVRFNPRFDRQETLSLLQVRSYNSYYGKSNRHSGLINMRLYISV